MLLIPAIEVVRDRRTGRVVSDRVVVAGWDADRPLQVLVVEGGEGEDNFLAPASDCLGVVVALWSGAQLRVPRSLMAPMTAPARKAQVKSASSVTMA